MTDTCGKTVALLTKWSVDMVGNCSCPILALIHFMVSEKMCFPDEGRTDDGQMMDTRATTLALLTESSRAKHTKWSTFTPDFPPFAMCMIWAAIFEIQAILRQVIRMAPK